jgi:hypothetical protein
MRNSEALILLPCFALVNCAKGREGNADNLPLVEPEQIIMCMERNVYFETNITNELKYCSNICRSIVVI